ncbi:MAG: hypothetical protein ABSD38_17175 [Syntrophorhabdales bacterium]|jgi:hypothetical protein
MKRLIVLSLLTVMLLAGGILAPAQAQSPANDLKPTFMSPTPGLYINGWPAFTVSYPKEWAELPTFTGDVFAAGAARPDIAPGAYVPILRVAVVFNPSPLEDWAKWIMAVMPEIFTDIKVLSDKPSQLKDGTPAREVEWEGVLKNDRNAGSVKNGPKFSIFQLMTKKDLAWVVIYLVDIKTIGEDLKKYAYSLTFLQGREEPVQVPSDVRAFLDMYCADIVSHDVKTIMAHYSDRFLWSGLRKAYYEDSFRNGTYLKSPLQWGVISREAIVTVFEARGDKAYVDGFWLDKAKGDANALKSPMSYQQIINEHGEWKWFGNQK